MKIDAEIQKDVTAELKWDPSIHASEIGVAVKGGIVTLSGYVESFTEKWAAERAAQRVSGVRAVAEEIEVRLPGSSMRTDTELADVVANALDWNVSVPKDRIIIKVQDGLVTLSGEVDWQYQKDAAFNSICCLMGVAGINNLIAIKATVKPLDVKAKIENSFQRNAVLDARGIIVEAIDSKVVLKGTVHSLHEKQEAWTAAWAAPGVRQVVNEIKVSP
jgi:osmotically-inducible protein OsmY